jgi:hypothetical protein
MVRNCRRSSTAYFGLRFGGFFFSTILVSVQRVLGREVP